MFSVYHGGYLHINALYENIKHNALQSMIYVAMILH